MMKQKLLLTVLILVFLFISATAQTTLIESTWSGFVAFGLSAVFIQTLILHYWAGYRRLVLFFSSGYLLIFLFMCLVKAGITDVLISASKADAGLNHLIDFMKSPLPLMVVLVSISLYNKEKRP